MKTFTLADDEEKAALQFEADHDHPANNHGAIGGGIQYRFTPTGLGPVIIIKCTVCEQEQNITEFDKW